MNSKIIDNWLKELTLEEKCRLLTGGGALRTASNERLDVPYIEMSDGPHGIRRLIGHPSYPQDCNIEGGDPCYPTASAMGSSWNRELGERVGAAIARDCKQEKIDLLLAPAVNMKRTPLCGRNFEYYSEDPLLAGEMAAGFIKGVQSGGVGTSLKHFAANNQELNRSSVSVELDERTLREYYLEAFRIAIEKGNPETVMCAYNKLGGIWCSENKWLLSDVLKDEWGYDGLVVSDWNAVHDSAKAQRAGLQLQMPQNKDIYAHIKDGIEKGTVTEEEINQNLRRVLEYVLHRIDCRGDEAYDRAEQHKIAYEAACECITLLKNEDNVLPLCAQKLEKLAVIGTGAEDPVFMGGGSSAVTVEAASVDKPIDYIRRHCDGKCEVIFEPLGPDMTDSDRKQRIKTLSAECDTAVVFACSETLHETEEIDRTRLTFPEYLNDYLELASRSFKNLIVVMQSGCCTVLGEECQQNAKGIIQMWLTGEAGGRAIADVLFGTVNPSGKLSETFIKALRTDIVNVGADRNIRYSEGLDVGYRYYDKHEKQVWYPFGHGLSYTTFEYSDLKITPEKSEDPYQKVTVSFKLTNTGTRAGKEVAELFVAPVDSTVYRPQKELKGFEKIYLQAGETREVKMELDFHAFAYYNTYLHDWHVEGGDYEIQIGASSTDLRLSGIYNVEYPTDYTQSLKKKAIVL